MNLKILLFISLLFSAPIVMARDVIVLDSITKEPIPFATLTVMAEDSTQLYHANSDGCIKYVSQEKALQPEFKISASFYSTKRYVLSLPDTVFMIPNETLLNEVVVSGQREFVKPQENGFYIAISNNPVSKLASSVKMVQQLPLVDAANDKLSILGKRKTALYIGNRKVSDQSDILSYSPADIDAVEIVTEPGLKYGRDVDAVIIIHPKRSNPGLNLSLNGDYINQRGLSSVLGNGKASYTFPNNWTIEMFLAASKYGNKGIRDDSDSVRTAYSTNINAKNTYKSDKLLSQLSLFRDYKKASYGIKYTYTREPHTTSTTLGSFSSFFTDDRLVTGLLNSEIYSNSYKHSVNAYYSNSFSPDLSFNIDFNAYVGKKTDTDYSDYDSETQSSTNQSNHEMTYSLVEAKAVMGYTFKKFTLEGGIEYSYTSTEQDLSGNSTPVDGSAFNNQYQNLYVAFVSANYQATKEFRFNAGIRGEVTSNRYTSSDVSSDHSESDVYWTPNVSMAYVPKNVKFNFTYSANIYRPYYFFLTSGYTSLSPTLWQTGNPSLKIDREHNFDLSVNWRKTYAYISYGYSRNRCDYGLSYNPEEYYSVMYPVSVPQISSWAFMIQQRADIRNWHPTIVGILLLQDLHFGADNDSFNNPYLRLQWKNMLKLPLDIYAYANLNWESSGHTNLYYVHSRFRLDFSLSKGIGPFKINLSLDNLLNTWKLEYTLSSNGVCYIQNNKPYGPVVTFSCSYNLNQNKRKRSYQGGYSSSESKRF